MSFASLIGQTIDGKYKIESQLGKGGMGAVYLATHLGTERPVAVKVIVQQFMERAEFVERFRREARAAGRLRHPNVVDVTDFGVADTTSGKTAYLVMEYLDGCTLGEILEEEKKLPLTWSLDIIHQVCSAIHEAHGQGIIHRDLKPDNIWLEPNQRGGYTVKVLDFGIAKLEEHQDEPPTSENGYEGTPTGEIGVLPTIAESAQTMLSAGVGGTMISESNTLIVKPEAGTIIREAEDEKGTAIMMPARTDDDGTEILDAKGTKLIDGNSGSGSFVGESAEAAGTVELTRVGAVLGTPLYMSPEQCRGEKLSPKSDIYSLGIITYQMLAGRTPFEGDFSDVMYAHKELEPPKLETRKIPRRVRKVVHSALSKDPEARPQNAHAFSARLQASSDGIGALLIRAMTMFAERLPTFLAIAFLLSIPVLILGVLRGGFKFIVGVEMIASSTYIIVLLGIFEVIAFFAQIFTTALIMGVVTWVIAQILAVPLRPINLRTAFSKVRQRGRPLIITVTQSTFASLLGWVVASIAALIVAAPIGGVVYLIAGTDAAGIVGIFIGALVLVFLGIAITSAMMLVAPVIMMEGIKGIAAFKRSFQLVRRSFGTVFAAAMLNYFVPALLGLLITTIIAGLVGRSESKTETSTDKPAVSQAAKPDDGLNIQISGPGEVSITDQAIEDPERKARAMRKNLTTGIFELLWGPIVIFISSFTAIITALIYFKTRQAGGESMQDLLIQFEDDQPRSKWQERAQNKLIQSGRITSKP